METSEHLNYLQNLKILNGGKPWQRRIKSHLKKWRSKSALPKVKKMLNHLWKIAEFVSRKEPVEYPFDYCGGEGKFLSLEGQNE